MIYSYHLLQAIRDPKIHKASHIRLDRQEINALASELDTETRKITAFVEYLGSDI